MEDILMDMNKLAAVVANKEKGKKQVDVAQVKEIMRVLARELRGDTATLEAFLKYVRRVK